MYEKVKGTRDFLPEEKILREKIKNIIIKTFENFGYDPIETPIVEYWDTLKGKYGEEAENKLIWRFKLPYSDKEYALRYDHTVPLARFFSNHLNIQLPFKRYVIDKVYRYDEPQKNRYREFYQADYDIIGSSNILSDLEILKLTDKVFERLNIKDYKISINDRRLLDIFLDELKIEKEKRNKVLNIIDKLDKIGIDGVKKELEKILDKKIVEEIIESLNKKGNEELEYFYEKLKDKSENIINDLKFLLNKSKNTEFDFSLVRGLDYYTGLIFEVKLKNYNISFGGGGRYDNLIGLFTNKNIPAVGGSIGFDRVIDYLIENKIYSFDRKTVIDVCIIYFENTLEKALEIRDKLIDLGINTYIDLMGRDFKKQIDYCVNKNIKYLLIIGEKELSQNKVLLQNRENRERILIDINNLEKIKDYIKY